MVSVEGIATATVVFAVIVIGGLIRSWRSGYLRAALDKQHEAEKAHRTVTDINGTLDDVYAEVHETRERVEGLEGDVEEIQQAVEEGFRTLAVIHKDDEDVDRSELRDRLDVESLDDDVLTRGGDGD